MKIVDYAIIPARRSGPNMIKNTAIGVLAGAVLAAAVVVLRSLLNEQRNEMIESADDLRIMYPDIMILTMIPDMRVPEKKNGYYSSYYGTPDSKKKEGVKNGRGKGA